MKKKNVDLNSVSFVEQVSVLCGRPGRFNEITNPSNELLHWYFTSHPKNLSGDKFLSFDKELQMSLLTSRSFCSNPGKVLKRIINNLDNDVLVVCLYHFPQLTNLYIGKFPSSVQDCISTFLDDYVIANNIIKFDHHHFKALINKDVYNIAWIKEQPEDIQMLIIKKIVNKKTTQSSVKTNQHFEKTPLCRLIKNPSEKVLWELIKYDHEDVLKMFNNVLTPEMKAAITLMT